MNAGISRLTMVLAILAIAIIARAAPSAQAGAPTAYADSDGNRACASLSPCYLTVQDAVNHVGGPDAAEVGVFPGTYAESVDLSKMASGFNHTLGNLTLRTVDAVGNISAGTATIHGTTAITTGGQPFPKDVTLDGLVIQSTKSDGVFIHTMGAITIRHTSVDNPGDGSSSDDGDDGFDLATTGGGLVTIEDSMAERAHGTLGDGFQIVTSGGATLRNVQANNNRGTQDDVGINIPDSQGDITFDTVTANNNSEQGIAVYTTGKIFLSGSASNNGFYGADLFTELGTPAAAQSGVQQVEPAIIAKALTASGNADDGLIAQAAGDALVRESQANNNGGTGMTLLTSNSMEVIDSHAEGNVKQGIYIEAENRVTITKVSAIDNGDSGTGEAGLKIVGFGAAINSLMINDSLVKDNFGQGIDLFNLDAGGVHDASSNVICGNSKGGLRNNGAALTLPATGNWWGKANGPTSPQNPGGQGDKVNAGGDGTIDFGPWITKVEGAQVASTAGATGTPSTIVFQFSDDGHTVFLNNGPGDDLGDSKLTVTTDNGTLTSGAEVGQTVHGFITDKKLAVVLTPAHTGQANITLSGPCGLAGQTSVPVESGVLRGDLDCNGSVGLTDLMRSLRFTAGVKLETIGGCVAALGNFDLDCGGAANGVDPLLLALYLADLPPLANLPVSCPHVGT